jgi:hypothetical protein
MKYIYHHLGLGDHIICNGLVRSLIEKDQQYKLFVKSRNLKSVSFMYRDLHNLSFLTSDDNDMDSTVNFYIKEQEIKNCDVIKAGFYKHPESKEFDDSFYLQNDLPFEYRWSKFFFERDIESEKNIFNNFGVTEGNYIFIHDDSDRGININESFILNKSLKVVRPIKGLTDNIFDYCYLMENSKEAHFIDSSFRLLFDSLQINNDDIFYHLSYQSVIRDYTTKSQSKLNFKIL